MIQADRPVTGLQFGRDRLETRPYDVKVHTPEAATGAVAIRRNQEPARALWKLFVLR